MLFISFLLLHLTLLHIEGATIQSTKRVHWVIVTDAGSTKTEMNLFQMALTPQGAWEPRQTLSKKWKKGLSEFDPNKDADKKVLEKASADLIGEADQIITDSNERAITPVFLYATAGLRALPKSRAEALLTVFKKPIQQSPYDKRFTNVGPERVSVISGAAEGVYAWLAVNYLLQPNLETQKADEDFGIVDLGGGSTQIVFRPDSAKVLKQANVAPSSLTRPLGQETTTKFGPGIFSKSFLNYGNSANIMKMVGAYEDCNSPTGCNGKTYASPCLPPDYQGDFEFGIHKIRLTGQTATSQSRFDICRAKQLAVLKKYGALPKNDMSSVRTLLSGSNTAFFGIASFYYATVYIDKKIKLESAGTKCEGFKLTVEDYYKGARKVCDELRSPVTNKYVAYSCLQTLYTATLLKDGYQRPNNAVIYACKKLKTQTGSNPVKVKASWAQGVSFQAAEKILEPNINTINRLE